MIRKARYLLPAIALLAACNQGNGAAAQSTGRQPFTLSSLATFDSPFALAFLPDGSALVTEKAGVLKLRTADGQIVTVGGVPAVAEGGQGGLLDIAPAPDFARSGIVYLTYAEPRATGSSLALMRARLLIGDRSAPHLTEQAVIWRAGSDGNGGQFGAIIAFAPDGKSLFLSSGERQRFTPAQDPNQALGKILHLTLDGKPAPGNPGAGKTGAASLGIIDPPKNTGAAAGAPTRPGATDALAPAETWSSGHRNPYGLAFGPDGRLWEHEMGPKGGDEVNLILPGKNYGWPNASNGSNYDGTDIPDHAASDGYEAPKVFWNPSISPAGMIVYTGNVFPQWKGSILMGAMSGEGLIRIALNGDTATKADQWNLGKRIRDVAQAPDGSVWLLEDGDGAKLMKLVPVRARP